MNLKYKQICLLLLRRKKQYTDRQKRQGVKIHKKIYPKLRSYYPSHKITITSSQK